MAKKLGMWRTQKIVYPGIVEHWGKMYVWMEDTDGTTYMTRVDEDGNPKFV